MARVAQQVRQLYEMCAVALVSGRANLDGASEVGFDVELPVFTVGRAAELAHIHPQTLRQYDRLGLVVPQRTDGGARRYSLRDVSRLAHAQQLSQTRASIWPASPASSTLRRRIASCAGRWPVCANPPAPACSPRTRTAASWKSNAAAVPVGGVGRFTSTPGAARASRTV